MVNIDKQRNYAMNIFKRFQNKILNCKRNQFYYEPKIN